MKTLLILTIVNVAVLMTAPFIALPQIEQTPFLLSAARGATALAPIASGALAVVLAVSLWRRRTWSVFALLLVALGCAALSRTHMLEWVFAPARSPNAAAIAEFHDIPDTDLVIGVVLGGRSRAYAVRYLAYHHMLNDRLGSVAVLPTYCGLCHTGLVWDPVVDGRLLHFFLGGLNRQNLVLEDEETGSWWQQATGECILGPMRGKRLRRLFSDEVTLAVWRTEHPESTAIRFDPKHLAQYPPSDWDRRPLFLTAPAERDLVVSVDRDGASAAYAFSTVKDQGPLNVRVGNTPMLLIVGADGSSVRGFVRPLADGKPLEFYRRPGSDTLVDGSTGSSWDFGGRAISGPQAGRALEPAQITKDYWSDWTQYHPGVNLRGR